MDYDSRQDQHDYINVKSIIAGTYDYLMSTDKRR